MILRILLVLLFTSGVALAQSWPSRPVRMVVPFAPGGVTDSSARLVAPKIQEAIGQPVIVENRTGAGGIVAADHVAKAAPDGYTILMGSTAAQTLLQHVQKVSYDGLNDFAPITLVNTFPIVLMVHPSVPANNVRELLALAKAKPGQVTYASYGSGSSAHLTAEHFKLMAGVDLLHVPYKGAAPAVNDLLGGQVQMGIFDVPVLLGHIRSGKLKALAVTSASRAPALPDVPTTAEAGLPAYNVDGGWFGMFAPANTPPEVLNKLHREVKAAMDLPKVRERLVNMGVQPVANSPAEFKKFFDDEMRIHADMVRVAGIQPE
jgi:tripartite-type tricarboxylate transporter receptor subunit TctC